MPTPIGHSLAGYAAARLTRVRLTRDDRLLFVFAAVIGILPDLAGQLLAVLAGVRVHGFSHSLVAMVLVSVTIAAAGSGRFRFWPLLLVVGAAYGSHLVADLLRPEYGVGDGEQIFWPLQTTYGLTHNILPHVPDRTAAGSTLGWTRELVELALRELLVLGPVAIAAHFIPPRLEARRARSRQRDERPVR